MSASAMPRLRPYQCEAGRAVLESVHGGHGRTFSIEIARQGGKNELSAQIELYLLARSMAEPRDGVKCAPTYRPQLRVSMRRLRDRIAQAGLARQATVRDQAIGLGAARMLFLSAEATANVVGHTASLLLEVDEAQDVDAEKFDREFRPMAATANATTVFYGTPWDDRTLLERMKQAHLEAERRDGVRRHFAFDWTVVARHNASYEAYVEAERARLGDTHPVFLTQYCLKTVAGAGRLFSVSQRAQLAGTHPRAPAPEPGTCYVAGLDIAGGDGEREARAGRDSTVLTLARLAFPGAAAPVQEPRAEIVEHIAWTGEPHERLLPRLIDLLRDVWRVERVAVDATGLGETMARMLVAALGEPRVAAVKFTAERKSELGFALIAAVNGGRLKAYAGDGSAEHREFWRQVEAARVAYRANRTMSFYVEEAEGHDDYLVSAALAVHASRGRTRRVATGRLRA